MQPRRLPPVSQEFLDILDSAFEKPDVIPGVDRDELMYKAGARSVVEWIKKHTSTSTTSGPAAQMAQVRYGAPIN